MMTRRKDSSVCACVIGNTLMTLETRSGYINPRKGNRIKLKTFCGLLTKHFLPKFLEKRVFLI